MNDTGSTITLVDRLRELARSEQIDLSVAAEAAVTIYLMKEEVERLRDEVRKLKHGESISIIPKAIEVTLESISNDSVPKREDVRG